MSFADLSKTSAADVIDLLGADAIYIWGCGATKTCNVVHDRQVEFRDEDGTSFYGDTIDVLVAEIEASDVGDEIQIDGKTYSIGRILEDDGVVRKVAVQ
jgi:hypothetical protein